METFVVTSESVRESLAYTWGEGSRMYRAQVDNRFLYRLPRTLHSSYVGHEADAEINLRRQLRDYARQEIDRAYRNVPTSRLVQQEMITANEWIPPLGSIGTYAGVTITATNSDQIRFRRSQTTGGVRSIFNRGDSTWTVTVDPAYDMVHDHFKSTIDTYFMDESTIIRNWMEEYQKSKVEPKKPDPKPPEQLRLFD